MITAREKNPSLVCNSFFMLFTVKSSLNNDHSLYSLIGEISSKLKVYLNSTSLYILQLIYNIVNFAHLMRGDDFQLNTYVYQG